MKQVVFLYSNLLDRKQQELAKLPLEFISFAYIDKAVLYDMKTQYVALRENTLKKTRRYNKVYGALYILHDSQHYIKVLDAYMTCSKAFIGSNHVNDLHHRERIIAFPIHFKTLEEFVSMRYNEGEGLEVIVYLANPNNDVIKTNILNTVKNRETSGIDINNFIDLILKELENEKKEYNLDRKRE